MFNLCVQDSQTSLRAVILLSKFERSIGWLERRSTSMLEIAIKWVSECERSISVLRMAMNWLSDCEFGRSLYVSRQVSLHLCPTPEHQPPEQSRYTDIRMSPVSTFIL